MSILALLFFALGSMDKIAAVYGPSAGGGAAAGWIACHLLDAHYKWELGAAAAPIGIFLGAMVAIAVRLFFAE